MALLYDETDTRNAMEFANARPVAGFDPGFVERFKADFANQQLWNSSIADQQGRFDTVGEFLGEFHRQSGQRATNWVGLEEGDAALAKQYQDQARSQFDAWKVNNPMSPLVFPGDEDIQKSGDLKRITARRESQRLSDRSSSWASTLGGLAGSIVGGATDPVNVVSMMFGAGAGGVLRTAIVEGGLGAGSEAIIQAQTFEDKKRLDPSFTASEAITEVGMAGLGAAVIGGGLKGLAEVWNRARTGEWSRSIQDAGNLVQREASIPPARLDQSARGSAIHRQALEKASDDMARGQPIAIPEEAFLQGNARIGRVYDADGASHGVRYEVVEAGDLITSNRDDLSINPDFPAVLQPRDRSRAISRDQIQSIASNLQPERLGPSPQADSGAPIVGIDGVVESGNGRVMALRQAYSDNGVSAGNYKAFLRRQGFDVDGFERPVLVARRVTDIADDARAQFVVAANRSTAMRMGAGEQALADARLLDEAVLSKLEGADGDAISNPAFTRAFMSKLPRAEQGELVDKNGVLSQVGERRILGALMGRAYGEPVLLGRALEDADSNIKALAGALGDAAPAWAAMRDAVARGDIPPGMDVTGDLLEAMRIVMKARDEGRAVKDMVNQAEMFGGPGEYARIMARAMFNEDMSRAVSRKRMAQFLNDFATEARKNDAGPRLFGDALDAKDVLQSSLSRVGRADLETVALERLTAERVEAVAKEPATHEAVIEDALRLQDASERAAKVGKEQPVIVDLDDGLGPRSLSDIMKEADDDIAASQELEMCLVGGAREAAE